jgi:hypothetical protein
MKQLRSASTLALIVVLAGCAANERSGTGTSVRAIMASQVIPPRPHAETGNDGAAAMAGYANYQRSYESPTPQGSSAMVGSGLSK